MVFHLNAQTPVTPDLPEDRLITYFDALRESVFLHLNKTAFIPGEEVWFKAYVYDRKNHKPFIETTNLNVAIYDSVGEFFSQQLIYMDKGYGSGSFKIDSTFKSGKYYLKASTNWMKNFREDDSFIQEFQVLGNSLEVPSQINSEEIIVRFLPEGGNIIVNTVNTIGVTIQNTQGIGINIKEAVVRDEKGRKVTSFNTTRYGLGNFLFKPRKGMKYYAEILFENDSIKKQELPRPLSKGLTLAIEQKNDEEVIVFIGTNKVALKALANKTFDLLFHRDGIVNKIDVKFNQVDTTYAFVFEKAILMDGMNIFTLIDNESDLIAERLYYNFPENMIPKIAINFVEEEMDSLVFEIEAGTNVHELQNLSISVLPTNTKAYRQGQNILSSFNLNPYVQGSIENPAYYFNDLDNTKRKELDLLLLSLGNSRCKWKNLNSTSEKKYEFEQGIGLKGKINMKSGLDNKVVLFPTINHPSIMEDLDQDNFEFNNLILMKDERLIFSILENNKKLVKPKVYIETQNIFAENPIEIQEQTLVTLGNNKSIQIDTSKLFYDGVEELDEVFLVGNKEVKAESNIYVNAYLKDKVTEITKDIAYNFQYITDVIRSKGYEVRLGLVGGSVERLIIRIKNTQSLLGKTELAFPEPIIYLDDHRLINFDLLYNVLTSDFESYYFQRSGAGEGSRGAGGVIRLYSKREKSKDKNFKNPEQSMEYVVDNGFEFFKDFYMPKYRSFNNSTFEEYGVIHWDPEVKINRNEKVRFKIFNTGINNITFYYEGMGENGSLMSGKQDVTLN